MKAPPTRAEYERVRKNAARLRSRLRDMCRQQAREFWEFNPNGQAQASMDDSFDPEEGDR